MVFPRRYKPQAVSYKKGATLAEALVYIVILVVFSTILVNTMLLSLRTFHRLRAARKINATAIAAVERMTREARNATSTDVAASTLGSSPGVLLLNTFDASDNPTTVGFSVSSGALAVSEGGSGAGVLTPSGITVDSLIFYRIDTGSSEAIRAELELTAVSGNTTVTRTFYTAAVLRGSY